jgi:nitric oxide reductase NorQ protein
MQITATSPIEQLTVSQEPYYLDVAELLPKALTAYEARIPILLRGPTGCGKTRFVERLVWEIDQRRAAAGNHQPMPLMTVACHEDLTSVDLVGRYVLRGEETIWVDGPLTTSVRNGGVCYLDELSEARRDTTVVVHAVTDYRRVLPIERLGTVLSAHESFLLVASHNPDRGLGIRRMRESTSQRFMTFDFDYPEPDAEAEVLVAEAGVDADLAQMLVKFACGLRVQQESVGSVLPSTRLLVHAAQLIAHGADPLDACELAVVRTVAVDPTEQQGMMELATALLPR